MIFTYFLLDEGISITRAKNDKVSLYRGGFIMTDNFFTDALYQYYLQSGKSMSENVSQVLSKSLIELSEEERESYRTYILPSTGVIKSQIKEMLDQPGVSKEEWQAQLQNYGQSIIGQMVAEVIIELGVPTAAVEEAAPQAVEETPQLPQVEAAPVPPVPSQEAPAPAPRVPPPAPVPPVPPQKKKNVKKLVIIGVAVVVVLAVIGAIVGTTSSKDKEETKTETKTETTTTESTKPKTISLSITTPTAMQEVMNPQIMVSGQTEKGAEVSVWLSGKQIGGCYADNNGSYAAITNLPGTPASYSLVVKAKSDNGTAERNVTCVVIENPAAYKAKCQTLDYRVVSKNADNYIGQFYYIRGEVFQIMEQGGTTFMLVAVTDNGYGYWSDNVAVNITGTTDALEESIVRVWGSCAGSYTYTSVANYTITVPQIDAEYVEVEKL
jgi:hypothetical protein